MATEATNPDGTRQLVASTTARAVWNPGLRTPEKPSTNGSQPGLWATATVNGNNNATGASKKNGDGLRTRVMRWGTTRVTTNGGSPSPQSTGKGSRLEDQVAKTWSTPQTRDNRSGHPDRRTHPDRSKNLNDQMGIVNAKLNARWVETLMGIPVGWTMPSCANPVIIELTNFDFAETESYPPPPSVPTECFFPGF